MTDPRYVEIRGTEFVNKGAELMMHAVLDRLPDRWIPVIEPSRRNPRAMLESVGARPKRSGIPWLPGGADDVPDEAIHAVLDASGFAYSDFWGPRRARRRTGRHLDRWTAQGKVVILLPQAFGPFENAKLRNVMREIVSRADLVFPRDPTSLAHIQSLGAAGSVHMAPDFTNLLAGTPPSDPAGLSRSVLVVPNARMTQVGARAYVPALVRTMQRIRQTGFEPVLLLQETGRDVGLARRIARRLDPSPPVIREESSLAIKGLIGAAAAVVTSRFHSLVCALSQGTPALATSWSHKYRHLVEDYDYAHALVEAADALPEAVVRLLDPVILERDRRHLQGAAEDVRRRSEAMWDRVLGVMDAV